MPASSVSRQKRLGVIGGIAVTVLMGGLLVWTTMGPGLARLSYDLHFLWRGPIAVPEVVIVYLDREAQHTLGQSEGPWDRSLHTRLLRRLTEEQAPLVFYDIFFEAERDPKTDGELAQAIREQGRVILGSRYVETLFQRDAGERAGLREFRAPIPLLRDAARGVGLMMLAEENVQRHLYTGTAEHESASWVAARIAGAPLPAAPEDRLRQRWLNFYGPAYHFTSVSLSQALEPGGLPPGFFRGRAVFVGGHPAISPGERFATPYTRFVKRSEDRSKDRFENAASPGVEVHATAFLNLTRNEWLSELSLGWQLAWVLVWGVLFGGGLLRLRPWPAVGVTVLGCLLLAAGSFQLQLQHHIWWPWLAPVAVQSPLALVWSIAFQYAVEGRRRRQLQKAFSVYLPRHLAERVAESDIDLALGGTEVEATVLFTDLEGFTALSDQLKPQEVSRLLATYFNQTTRHIHDQEGAIIKYIGDAVLAVWGAPLPVSHPEERAVLAACGMIEEGKTEVLGRRLRTRIGIHSGRVLAGNFGSDFRFDYTVIGATTNLASRLEGMNQELGTNILTSETTRSQLSERLRARYLGQFRVRGFSEPVRIHEVLGTAAAVSIQPEWLAIFEEALSRLEQREWSRSEALFRQVLALRQGVDGPSEFFLRRIPTLRDRIWDGIHGPVD